MKFNETIGYDETNQMVSASSILVSIPAFKLGQSYTIKTTGYEKTFIFKENFTIVR